jgi:dienelactone hydrolase
MEIMPRIFGVLLATVAVLGMPLAVWAAEKDGLAAKLRELDTRVVPADSELGKQLGRMLAKDVRSRIQAANERESKAWRAIKTKADWERYRDQRIRALRESLGVYPPAPKEMKIIVKATHTGDGYRCENVIFESRKSVFVTANLYAPADPPKSMPGILIVHSHHNPKTQGELQDMGMIWARAGCLVLVMDQLGHGERRMHPFIDQKSYPEAFRPSRQDYYFRYNLGMQLHVIGDSLIGWMVWDLMRGVDLLLGRKGIDKERIILLGSVAGGGDPAAVTAALDPRIAAVVPFNFGGPQPETVYPLPKNAEDAFNYAGGGSWESTRNLRLSARDGFLPWVIVGAVAPRRLIYAHEFSWDEERDPVWRRLEKIYGFYDARDHLTFSHGRGKVTGKPPESTHCNNIGPEHRKAIYAAFKSWFSIPEPDPKKELKRRTADSLLCMPVNSDKIKSDTRVGMGKAVVERALASHRRLRALAPAERRQQLRRDWGRLLGDPEPGEKIKTLSTKSEMLGDVKMERIALEVEPGIVVPLLLLVPPRKAAGRVPLVIGVCQEGKKAFLAKRAEAIGALLKAGVAVCLPEVRGTGETKPTGDSRGRASVSTGLSSSELMLGRTMFGLRLRDLRAVLKHLRGRADLDAKGVALWGESFASPNPKDRRLEVPWDAAKLPDQSEPLSGLLAMFGALFEDDIRAIYARGGLVGFGSRLADPFRYVPHDVIVPGALAAGDLFEVVPALAPRPLHLEGFVDGLNRTVNASDLAKMYESARSSYQAAKATDRLTIVEEGGKPAEWLIKQLKKP